MKRIVIAVLFAGLAGSGIYCWINCPHGAAEARNMPAPTETIVLDKDEENEDEEIRRREEWMENMHRAAPGTDWRAMDFATKKANYERRKALGPRNQASKVATYDTLAGGNLIGNWFERGSVNQAGRIIVADLDTVNDIIYLGSAGGIVWKGNVDGSNWVPLNDDWQFNDIQTVRVIPNNSGGQRIFVAAGRNNAFFSDDDGATWLTATGLSNAQNWGSIKRAVVLDDANHTIYVLLTEWDYTNWNSETSLYRSQDKGSTFSKITSWPEPTFRNINGKDIWAATYSDSLAYFILDSLVYELNPGTGAPTQVGQINLNPGTGAPNRVYLTGHKSTAAGTYLYAFVDQDIYQSTDAGANWSFKGNVGYNPFRQTSFSVSLDDPEMLFFGQVDAHKSTDGGATWTQLNNWYSYYGAVATDLHADIPSILSYYDRNGDEFQFICTDGGIYISHDDLLTFENLSLHGLNVSQYYSTYTHRGQTDYIYVGTQDQGFQRCQQDSGTVLGFNQVVSGDYGHIVSGNNGTSIWTNYPGFTHYYNFALNGNPTASWDFDTYDIPLWLPPLMSHPVSPTRCYIAGGNVSGTGSKLLELSYTGANIQVTEMPYDFEAASGGGFISALDWDANNPTHFYVLTDNGKFFRSTDSGNNWTPTSSFNGPTNHWFYGSDILIASNGDIYLAGSGYNNPPVFRSTNGGTSFSSIQGSLPNTMVYQMAENHDGSLIFAATEVGPYVYVVSQNVWYPVDDGQAPDQIYWCVDYIPALRTARFGTYGRGIWDFTEAPPLVAVNEPGEKPEMKVYPNPARNEVNVNGLEGGVLEVWNTAGQQILRTQIEAGLAQTQLDVSGWEAGIYWVALRRPEGREVKKLVVAR